MRTCAKCGRPLIHPLGGGDPLYCWSCNTEYHPDIVKPHRRKEKREQSATEEVPAESASE